MDETWGHGLPTCMDESIVEHIERNRREESGFRKPMGGNDHWESRHWRIRSSSTRSERCSTRVWEEDFLGFSYGFRPGRSQHDALDALWVGHCAQEGELDSGSGHPILFRQTPALVGWSSLLNIGSEIDEWSA